MKKIRITLSLMLLLALCAVALTACKSSLSVPTDLELNVETQTLSWKFVKGAKFYTIQISGQEREITTKSNTVSLEDLEAGEYEIRVKASGDGEVYKDSDWAVFQFTREQETGLRYKLINNNTAYELVGGGTASGDVVMEDVFRGKPVVAIADKALYGNNKITSFVVSKNVKTIGDKAFAKCGALTAVTIPEGVTSIGEYAFQSCKVMETVSLPDSVTVITPYMFAWCKALTSVTVGQYITTIGDYAFDNCTMLTSFSYTGSDNTGSKVTIPKQVQYIGEYAFSDCITFTELEIGESAQLIGSYAFSGCKALNKVKIGENVQTIMDYAFAKCPELTTIAIPDSVQMLGEGAFFSCDLLSEVSLGTGLQSVARYAFTNTAIWKNAESMLTIDGWLLEVMDKTIAKLVISSDIYGIADYAVSYCSKLVQVDLKGIKYVGMASFAANSELYRIGFDDALLLLGDYALYGCPYLESVDLGNSLQRIGSYAFASCEKLQDKITIPETVTFIGTRAFRKTAAYNAVNPSKGGAVYMGNWVVDYVYSTFGAYIGDGTVAIKDGVRGIASYTFSNKRIRSIIMPDSVEYVCRGAFYNCATSSIRLSASLKYIDDYAFYNCAYANFGGENYDLVIPEGTVYIGRSAFYSCGSVVSATIPGSVKTIGPYAFYGCSLLGAAVEVTTDTGEKDEAGNPINKVTTIQGTLTLGEGIETIGDRAFQNCTYMRAVVIPNSVTSIGSRVFYKCESLQSAKIGSGITAISEYMFYKCIALESVELPDTLESIGNYAFRGCEMLKNVDMKAVKTIGRYSFYGCKALEVMVLPEGLTSIGDYAFRGCTSVASFVIPSSVTEIGKHVFYGLNNTTLYTEVDSVQPLWNAHYNSSFRPVFWGCTLSDDGEYVVSFETGKDVIINPLATNGISDPVRKGYTFAGWATEQGSTTVAYTSETVADAPEGVELYAIWTQSADETQT